jgi:hypothetical protein
MEYEICYLSKMDGEHLHWLLMNQHLCIVGNRISDYNSRQKTYHVRDATVVLSSKIKEYDVLTIDARKSRQVSAARKTLEKLVRKKEYPGIKFVDQPENV